MKNLQVYESNAGLRFNQLVYLIKINEPNKYLCIDKSFICNSDEYHVGNILIYNNFEIKPSDYKLENSPLFENFLFQYFLKNL